MELAELAELARGSCKTSFPDLSLSPSTTHTHTHHPLHLSTTYLTLFQLTVSHSISESYQTLCLPCTLAHGGEEGTRGGAGLVYHPGYPASLTLRNKSQPSPSWQSHLLA